MKTLYRYFTLGFMLCGIGIQAQNSGREIHVHQKQLEQRGMMLYVNMDIDLSQSALPSNQGMVLTPVLQSADTLKLLPELIINGRKRDLSYRRTLDAKRKEPDYASPYLATKLSKKGNQLITYKLALPFESWMKKAELVLVEDACGCADVRQQVSIRMLAQNIRLEQETTPYTPPVPAVVPPAKVAKTSSEQNVTYFDFPVGKSIFLTDYQQNAQELAKIHAVMEQIMNDRSLSIDSIEIVGAASPDGIYQINENLSKNRALALLAYLKRLYNIPEQLYTVRWIGEDWSGLEALVEQSDMQSKEAVLRIIRKVGIFAGREAQLMKLENGKPYQYMREQFFPTLRKVSYITIYTSQP